MITEEKQLLMLITNPMISLYRKTEKTNKKNTTIPRYAGASTKG